MATTKVDFKRELRELYTAKRSPTVVDVPELSYLMIDGRGDPNTSTEYQEAVSALFSVSYAARFALKRAGVIDFGVMPLQGLWWASDMSAFSIEDKSAWEWTMLIMQPDEVSADVLAEAKVKAAAKVPAAVLERLRLERFAEGQSAHVLHVGPYSARGRRSQACTSSSPSRAVSSPASTMRSTSGIPAARRPRSSRPSSASPCAEDPSASLRPRPPRLDWNRRGLAASSLPEGPSAIARRETVIRSARRSGQRACGCEKSKRSVDRPGLDSVGMATGRDEHLSRLARRVAEALPAELVEEVVLTGSVSRGMADEMSDVEMLVVTREPLELDDCFRLARAAGLAELGTWGAQGGPTRRVSGYRERVPLELIWWPRDYAEEQIDALLAGAKHSTADALAHGIPLLTSGRLAISRCFIGRATRTGGWTGSSPKRLTPSWSGLPSR